MHRVALLMTLVILAAGAASRADEPVVCNGIELSASAEELAATPREDRDLEVLASTMTDRVVVTQALYERVVRDVQLIREAVPAVSGIDFDASYYPPSLLVSVDDPTLAAIQAGSYHAWDCLDAAYGFEVARIFAAPLRLVVLATDGVLDMETVAAEYGALPGVVQALPDSHAGPGVPLPYSSICGLGEGSTHHYFFIDDTAEVSVRYFVVGDESPQIDDRGGWSYGTPKPPWEEILTACQLGQKTVGGRIETVPETPTVEDNVVLELSGSAGSSACGPFFEGVEDAGNAYRIVSVFNPSCGPCTADFAPYAFDVPLGGLAAGGYEVTHVIRDGCTDESTLEATERFTVLAEPPPDVACAGGAGPAATLLLPYFEADLATEGGADTLFSVGNQAGEAVRANVVVWTDLGLPVLAFTFDLGAGAVQPFSMRRLLADGKLPATTCNAPPALDPEGLADLRARLAGQPSPVDGQCYASTRPAEAPATGYVTVDVVGDCSAAAAAPGEAGYFGDGGRASDRNALWGDVYYVDEGESSAQGLAMVAVHADPDAFARATGGVETFYGGWVGHDGSDHREPLGWRYRTRYLSGGAFDGGTELLVWSEGAGVHAAPRNCADPPYGAVSTQLQIQARDEGGTPFGFESFILAERTTKLQVGGERLELFRPFGELDLSANESCSICSPPVGGSLQLWLAPVLSASGRYSVAYDAVRLDGPCR